MKIIKELGFFEHNPKTNEIKQIVFNDNEIKLKFKEIIPVWHGQDADFKFNLIFNIEKIDNLELVLQAYICYYLNKKDITDNISYELQGKYFIINYDEMIKEILDFEEKIKEKNYSISSNIYGTICEINELEAETNEYIDRINKITEELYQLNLDKKSLEASIRINQEYINKLKEYLEN